MTRHYFTKAVTTPRAPCDCITSGNPAKPKQHGADPHAKNCAVYTGILRPRRPNHRHKSVMVRLSNGQTRAMSSAVLAMRSGGKKGGRTAQARGTANRFTSESGRKASLHMWKRKKLSKRTGRRLGRVSKYKKAVDRAALRAAHATTGIRALGICFCSDNHQWFADGRGVTERTALRRLGYLDAKPYPVEVLSESNTAGERGKLVARKVSRIVDVGSQ